jgi:hypothetical protein
MVSAVSVSEKKTIEVYGVYGQMSRLTLRKRGLQFGEYARATNARL